MKVAVTVVVPVYNQGPYLAEALESVAAQTYKDWECIIVDDGSTDNTGEVAKPFTEKDERFRYYCIENGGPSKARNYGIEQANSAYILPLDGDDKISANYIEECIKVHNTTDQYKVVYGASRKFGLKNEVWDLGVYQRERMLFSNCIHPCGMYRKTDWTNMGGYDIKLREGLEDWEFWINFIGKSGEVKKLDNITFYWRVKQQSRTMLLQGSTIFQRMSRYIYHKHADEFNDFFTSPVELYLKHKELQTLWDWVNKHPLRFYLSRLKRRIIH